MRTQHSVTFTRAAFAWVLAALLVACGGDMTAGIEGTGKATPAAAQGPITSFGSIFVGGIEYSTSAAQILVDGQPGTESQLHVGQVVVVKGSVNSDGTTGAATSVSFSGDVQGPVTQVDVVNNTFTVLGQTVRINGATVLDQNLPADLTAVASGTVVVEVSGFADATGRIDASRIDLKPAGSPLQVKGSVQSLDTLAHTFHINGLVVDYSRASPVPTLANGTLVVVHGTTFTSGGALIATQIEASSGIAAAANQRADLDGFITTFTSNSDFVLQGQHVTADANTNFVLHGVTLAVNVMVDVQGTFDANGTLHAQKVEAQPQSQALVAGLVDSVNASGNTLSVLGVKVTLSSLTELDDDNSNQQGNGQSFKLSDLRVGDYVAVSGTEGPAGQVNAYAIQRSKKAKASVLQGVASNVFNPNLNILGVTVQTNANTVFAGPDGARSSATAFFTAAPNQLVLATGTYSGVVLTASKVQIKPASN